MADGVNEGSMATLTMPNLFAAFDMIKHSLLLRSLECFF